MHWICAKISAEIWDETGFFLDKIKNLGNFGAKCPNFNKRPPPVPVPNPAFSDENIVFIFFIVFLFFFSTRPVLGLVYPTCHDWMNHSIHFCILHSEWFIQSSKLYFHPQRREQTPTGHLGWYTLHSWVYHKDLYGGTSIRNAIVPYSVPGFVKKVNNRCLYWSGNIEITETPGFHIGQNLSLDTIFVTKPKFYPTKFCPL